MESVRSKDDVEQPNYVLVPITPNKTPNCTVNCAITSIDSSNITSPTTAIRYDSGGYIDSIQTTLIGGNNVLLNESVSPASILMATKSPETLCMSSGAGLERLSCSKGVRSDTVNQSDDDEVILTHPKNKKQKIGVELNKKPGEKRQNKYYWAKIDVPKPNTLAPKTPKAVTPKPLKAKTPKTSMPRPLRKNDKTPKTTSKPRGKNDKRRPIKRSEISDHVGEKTIVDSTCKKSLNFDLGPAKDTMCTQVLERNIKIKEKSVLVYRRRFNSRCLYICQNLVPRFEEKFKRKRLQRNKKSFGALRRFEGFNRKCLIASLLDRILKVKGKLKMLMPTKPDFSDDRFRCVLSLLSSRPVFTIKKRLPRTRRPTKPLFYPDETTSKLAGLSSPPIIESGSGKDIGNGEILGSGKPCDNTDKDGGNGETMCSAKPRDNTVLHGVTQQVKITPAPVAPVSRGRKANVIKDKNSKFKLKGKVGKLSLAKVSDWTDSNIEKILDEFALQLRSLKLYDDPKKWIVEVSDQNNKTDDLHEKIRLEEERIKLFNKIGKFLEEMYYYQGSKAFIKWNGSVLDSIVGVFLTQNVSDFLSSNAFMYLASKYPIKPPTNNITTNNITSNIIGVEHMDSEGMSSQGSSETVTLASQKVIVEHPDDKEEEAIPDPIDEEPWLAGPENAEELYDDALKEMIAAMPYLQDKKGQQSKDIHIDWEKIRVRFSKNTPRKPENEDSVDWDAVRKANQAEVADAIRHRGQHNIIAYKIQKALNRIVHDHGSLDLEWLRDAPPLVAKSYLLSFYGLGLKSVECLRLLCLRHLGFPVDVNIGRIVVRLGMVPIKPLPQGMPFHLLQKYPLEDEIQKYLSPRLSHLNQETLYLLHYQMIQFGKVFCHKRSPNCRACPFKSDCLYYASLSESSRQALPGPGRKTKSSKKLQIENPFGRIIRSPSRSLPLLTSNKSSCSETCASSLDVESSSQLAITYGNVSQKPVYFVEVPSSPKPEVEEEEERNARNAEQVELGDIEDYGNGFMHHLELNSEKNCVEESSSKNCASLEIVSVSANVACLPKFKSIARLRTQHQVYELPKDNQLLIKLKLEKQVGDVPYLLAIWPRDQMEKTCDNAESDPCSSEGECTSRDDGSTIPGTLLIPVQTGTNRSFPLNGTYFQMNEVFVDDETCKRPVNVPRDWIWNLKRRTLYCGSSASTIVRGTTEMEIRQCFRQGFICTRGFNRQTRAPMPLSSRFHNRPKAKSKQPEDRTKGKSQDNEDGPQAEIAK